MIIKNENLRERIETFPRYKRSPRLIIEPPVEQIEIKSPERKAIIGRTNLVQIIVTPVAMLTITILLGIVFHRGIYLLMGAVGTTVSSVFSIYTYIKEKKKCEKKNSERERIYSDYLLRKRKEIYHLREKEKECYQYNYPSISEIEKMINEMNSRIYERIYSDADFMNMVVGYKEGESSSPISVKYDELSTDKDSLELEAKELADEYMYIKNKPVCIDFKSVNVGLVGSKEVIQEQLHILISKMVFFHSYHDMEIILIINNEDRKEYDYLKWYPHFKVSSVGVGGIIDSGSVADQVLLSIHKVIKERENTSKTEKRDYSFIPHYLFIVEENKLIADHVITEFLYGQEKYGFSCIFTSNMTENLPENIGSIIKYDSPDRAVLVTEDRKLVNIPFNNDRLHGENLEWMARNLSILEHEQGMVMHLPENVSFFDIYKVKNPNGFEIEKNWANNTPEKSLAVPLGIRVTGEPLMLNLHEKEHGPHGLIAGTTGSGKSEIIQSYILSLAVNFSPQEVGFLLIDYKGGGMANQFKDLPHVLGIITNLDPAEAMRALVSIKSELSRRQAIFAKYDVNHINGYTSLYINGEVEEPLPHLFIIADEFAELKKEQPEFMAELVSTARLGRSLGIHLILATQKPTGVVTDQIWSNSRFKIALKVQDESDSKEIIKTADAAYIRNPGRAYLQVGNNEIYELFQSAYSGAECKEESGEEIIDDRVYFLNYLRQPELLNKDLSGGESENEKRKTQLEVTVKYINKIYYSKKRTEVKKPWLPPLSTYIVSPYLSGSVKNDYIKGEMFATLKAPIGMEDLPEKQEQREFIYDFRENGNLLIYGAPGYGKSVLFSTLVLSLGSINTTNELNIYILDLSNGGLLPLRDVPHCAEYMNIDDEEKLLRFMSYISEEIKRRKSLLAESSSMNFDMYNRKVEKKMPAILWIVENFDVGKEMNPELENFAKTLSRDGANLGIYICMSASAPGAIRFSISNNFKSKIALYMYDKSDLSSAVSKTGIVPKDIKGRAYVKTDDVYEVQLYTALDIIDEEAYIDGIKNICLEMRNNNSGNLIQKIRTMPEKLGIELLPSFINKDEVNDYLIPIGLRKEDLGCAYVDLRLGNQIILGSQGSGKTNLLKVMLLMASAKIKFYLIDNKMEEFITFREKRNVDYINCKEEFWSALTSIKELIANRKEQFETERNNGIQVSPKQYYSRLLPEVLLASDIEALASYVKEAGAKAEEMLIDMVEYNIIIIACSQGGYVRGTDALTRFLKEGSAGVVTGNFQQQSQFTSLVGRVAPQNAPGVAYLCNRGNVTEIKIAKVEE